MLTYEFKKGAGSAVNIRTAYGVTVEKSVGMIGRPKPKQVEAFDWKYLNGSTPDLRNRRYTNREITLSCWVTASSKQGLIDRMNNLTKFLTSDELIFMHVTFSNTDGVMGSVNKGLFYMVYLDNVSEPDFKWRYGKQMAKFTINLIEPCPIKKVLKLNVTSGETAIVEYEIDSETDIDIYTSGGTVILGCTQSSGIIEMANGEYVIATGDIEHASLHFDTESPEDTFEEIYQEI